MDILFKFVGAIYRSEQLAVDNFKIHTRANSKEQAIYNIKSQAKLDLGYHNTAGVDLIGELTIFYYNAKEIYKVNKNELTLTYTDFKDFDEEQNESTKISIEEAKYLSSKPEKTKWIATYENGYTEDVTDKIKISGACIVLDKTDYLFDDEDEVYWKNGIPFSSQIREVSES